MAPRAGQITDMANHPAKRHQVRVYYEDTDFTGMVYHGNIVNFFERGRTEYIRAVNVHHATLSDQGFQFVVRRLEVDYLMGARIDDLLEVRSEILEIKGARIEFIQQIWRESDCLARAKVTVGFVDAAGKPRRVPADWQQILIEPDGK